MFWIVLGLIDILVNLYLAFTAFTNHFFEQGIGFVLNILVGCVLIQVGFTKKNLEVVIEEVDERNKKIKALEEKINGLENIINQNNQIVVPETKKEKAPELGEEIKFEPPSRNIFMKR